MSSALKIESIEGHSDCNTVQTDPNSQQTSISETEINVGEVASRALASFVLLFTNSILSITVGVSKLTGFTILPTLILGHLTKKLHSANTTLAKHAFTPFKAWAEMLNKENIEMIDTYKVVSIMDKKLFFNPKNYAKQALESFKPVIAPISAALLVANAVLWVVTKPGYLAMHLPGFLCDGIVTGLIGVNKLIGHLTYSPLKNLSDKMFEKQMSWMSFILDHLPAF